MDIQNQQLANLPALPPFRLFFWMRPRQVLPRRLGLNHRCASKAEDRGLWLRETGEHGNGEKARIKNRDA